MSTTRAARRYTESGMELTQTDGRGNTTTQVTDLAGRTLSVTDAAGATTSTTYAADSDQPATVTDALGNTAHYRYDLRGRKVAEWGTAIQPALYAYDDADRLTALTTFRAEDSSQTTDPSNRKDGDVTSWVYDEATGLELEKRYADGSTVSKTYDSFANPATETNARGQVTCYTYDTFRNLLLVMTFSDGTTPEQFTYNHLGQLTQVTDAAGTRSISYNRYGEAETDELTAGSITHRITEQHDALGRSEGYTYAKNGIPQQQRTIGYGADGRVGTVGFTHQGENKQFTYTPYGEVSPAHGYDQPLRWASEYHDVELGLVYYNYRHYNPAMGRWTARELFFLIFNLYRSFANYPNATSDFIGNWDYNYNYIAEAKIKQFSSEEDFKKGEEIAYIFKRDRNDISAYYTGFTRANSYDKLHTIKKREEFDPNEDCKPCISLLTIYAHGYYESGNAHLNVGNDKVLMESEDGRRKGISVFFNKKNINFCKKAVLNIRSCTIGNVKRIKREIRNYYKTKGIDLTVNTYEDFIWPSGSPNWAYDTVIGVIKLPEGACAIKG